MLLPHDTIVRQRGNDNVTRTSSPNERKTKAIIHSHGKYEKGYQNDKFSNKDKWVYYNNGVDGYVATPDGSLQKYDVESTQTTVISTQLPSDPKDPERKNEVNPTDVPSQEESAKKAKVETPKKEEEDQKK